MGHAVIAVVLFALQIIYICRVDWVHKAARAHNICLKKSHQKTLDRSAAISLTVLSGSELTKIDFVSTVDCENTVQVPNIEAGGEQSSVRPSLKKKLFKKALLFIFFVLLFVTSYLVKDLYYTPPSSIDFIRRPKFSNWTFLDLKEPRNFTLFNKNSQF